MLAANGHGLMEVRMPSQSADTTAIESDSINPPRESLWSRPGRI